MRHVRWSWLGVLVIAACASSPEARAPHGDPLAGCSPIEKPVGGLAFGCDGFTVQWQATDTPTERQAELVASSRQRLIHSGAVPNGALREEEQGGLFRLRTNERPLVDVYALDGPRGRLVLWCTYPKASGEDTCRDVRAALLSPEQTSYWAPPVAPDS